MSRIVSVWLPRWPIQRFLAAQALQAKDSGKPVDPEQPFVLAIAGAGGPRIAALNEAAEQYGLGAGSLLADARAKAEGLQVRNLDPPADDAVLRRLTLWATRYTPTASPWLEEFGGEANGADGFFLDIEGSSHLFGGEEKLIADLNARLTRFGFAARLAVAATPGAAWAASHFHASSLAIVPNGREAEVLAAMPIEALRLNVETRIALRRLGFKTIGALIDQPRAPFAARFTAELLRRLDQALGRRDEPLAPIVAPPLYHSLHYLLEPIVTSEAIVARAGRLMQNLVHVLIRDDVGARTVRLCLYRVDGAVETIDIGLTLPTRDVAHVQRLIALRLETLAGMGDLDAHLGFGFEALGLAVTNAEAMTARQTELAAFAADGVGAERYAGLIDALRQRLGPNHVRQFEPVESHLPERAETTVEVDSALTSANWPNADQMDQTRPLLLLPRAERADDVTALVPDGPPRRFCWRGVTYDIKGAQGPERIGAEWWREQKPTRDYYLVEDESGRRLWIYREGLYGRETATPQWFVQGLFA
jgi:protein ImuB